MSKRDPVAIRWNELCLGLVCNRHAAQHWGPAIEREEILKMSDYPLPWEIDELSWNEEVPHGPQVH